MATDSAYVMAAGDIANSGASNVTRVKYTGKLLDGWHGANTPLYILPLGDNAYTDATLAEYNSNFDPYWGAGSTSGGYTWEDKYSDLYPVPGNHEARLSSTTYAGYGSYFGARAFASSSYRWSKQITSKDGNAYWRVIGLDTNVMTNAAQISFLRSELAAALAASQHVIISYHHPLWTTGGYAPGIAGIGGSASAGNAATGIIGAIQDPNYAGNIKIILNGHDHLYVRYRPLRCGNYTSSGAGWAQQVSTVANGFTQIVVGTGGNAPDTDTASANHSNVEYVFDGSNDQGVLRMDLRADSAICEFVQGDDTTAGTVLDSFTITAPSTDPPPVPQPPLSEMPMNIPRVWDTAWGSVGNARHEGRPQAVVKKGAYIYVGGNFNRVNDLAVDNATYTRNNIFRYTATTGALDTSWNPDLNGQVMSMCLSADESTLFVSGEFTTVGSTARNYIAGFTTSTGALSSHFSGFACNNPVDSCVIDSTSLYVGGRFTSIGGSTRNRAAKLSVATTTVTVDGSWNPNVSQPVVCIDLAIDTGVHKIALNIDPQGSVGGTGVYSLAMVNSTSGALLWGANPNAGGGYVMATNDDHNGGQVYFGSRLSGGNRIFAYSYAGLQQWWFSGNGDVQGVGFYDNNVVVAKHDSMCASVKNSTTYNQTAQGVFIVNKDGVLQSAPWRSQFVQGDNTAFGVLACFGAFGIEEADFAALVMTGEFGGVRNYAGTQTKNPAPWRIAQFNSTVTTEPPGTNGWGDGYWSGDYWGSVAGVAQNATITVPFPGNFSFAAAAPAITITPNAADTDVIAPAGAFNFTAAQPVIEVNGIPVEVTAPAGQFSFAMGSHGVNTTSVTISLRRPKVLKSQQKIVQQGQVER